jgi:catechol 2,3-dioxygenase-like lactoylglutathione lyase family enzyme
MILLVKDYDEALSFYVGKLGFEKLYDQTVADDLRFVHVGVPGQENVGLWMLKAGPGEKSLVGRQAGSQPLFVLYTANCQKTYKTLVPRGVEFMYEPEDTEGDVHVHFKDLYGNQIVLVELKD